MSGADPKREFLRHMLATVAYRGGKALRDAPESFAMLKISESSRAPVEILSHIGDLYDWALSLAQGKEAWFNSTPQSWGTEVERFFESLKRLEDFLSSTQPLACDPEKLFQGPIADSLTHIGQIGMLRRVGGSHVRGENYFKAEIGSGNVGPQQKPPVREFD
jgi:hypothetical protein